MRLKWLGVMRLKGSGNSPTTRLDRLAAHIESLAEKDDEVIRRSREVAAMRQRAATELHTICLDFTAGVNRLLSHPDLQLDPPDYPEGAFNEDGINLLQLNVRGRLLQIEFRSTDELISTENFRIPYTLEGSIRSFNQKLLERDTIEEQLIFYCVEPEKSYWRFFDARTYRSGPFDQDYLISLLEHLL